MNGRWIDQFPPIREYDLELDEDIYELKMADLEAAQAAADRAEESARQAQEIADAMREEIPTKVSELENDVGYLNQEIDPTVPAWAKQAQKPSYTPQEVGALSANTYIPSKTSDLTNDSNYPVDANYVHTDNNFTTEEKNKLEGIAAGAEVNVNADWNAVSGDAAILNKPTKVSDFQNDAGYITGYTETDPTVPSWAKASTKPSYTASEVGAPTVQEMNTAINNAIGSVNSFDIAVVQTLPSENISTHTIYLVPKTGETNDVYDEYIYINNAWEMVGNTQIDLSDYATKSEIPDIPVEDVQINGTSIVSDGVANVPVAILPSTGSQPGNLGVIRLKPDRGISINAIDNSIYITYAAANYIKQGIHSFAPITPAYQQYSAFYGLAKIAGHDEKNSTLPAGQYTDAAKSAIQDMLNVPDKSDIPDVPVEDVQINGTSIVSDGVANVPIASNINVNYGVVKLSSSRGLTIDANGELRINPASSAVIKSGGSEFAPLGAYRIKEGVFYGLAKAAGDTTQAQSSNAVGTYTENAKSAIQEMIGVTDTVNNASSMLATVETTTTASKAYAIGDLLIYDGQLYKVTSAITLGGAIIPDGNVEATTIEQELSIANNDVTDVQVNGTSVVNNGVANVPVAGASGTAEYGVIRISRSFGVDISNGYLQLYEVNHQLISQGTNKYIALSPKWQHEAAFYGLAKAAGDSTQSASSNAVGTYTDEAKAAIQTMLNVPDKSDITVEDVQIDGTSIVSNGVASIPIAVIPSGGIVSNLGLVKVRNGYDGLRLNTSGNDPGRLSLNPTASSTIKSGNDGYAAVTVLRQHEASFYGLAKAAGDTTQASSSNVVGQYTNEAKSAIHTMLGIDPASIAAQVEIPLVETVSGTTPVITGEPNVRYKCGEVSTITITPPASGSIDVIFDSGSTAAVLTVPNTVRWPEWFDATELETDKTYEILITDSVYGSVMSWVI